MQGSTLNGGERIRNTEEMRVIAWRVRNVGTNNVFLFATGQQGYVIPPGETEKFDVQPEETPQFRIDDIPIFFGGAGVNSIVIIRETLV